MRNFIIFIFLALAIHGYAQVNRLGIAPFELKGDVRQEDRDLSDVMGNLMREEVVRYGYYEVLPLKEVQQIFATHEVSLEQIHNWDQRNEAFKKVSGKSDYFVVGRITCNPDGLRVAVGSELVCACDGRILKSAALEDDKRYLRALAQNLAGRLKLSKEEVLSEIGRGYEASSQAGNYARAISFCTWGISIEPDSWELYQQRALTSEQDGAYALASEDYAQVVKLRGKATKKMEKDIERIESLLEGIKAERKGLLDEISECWNQVEQENIPKRLQLLLDLAGDFPGEPKEKKAAQKMAKRATEMQKNLAAFKEDVQKEEREKASKVSNQRLKDLKKNLENTRSDARGLLAEFAAEFGRYGTDYFDRAMNLYREGKLGEALAMLDKAVLFAPSASNAYYWKGIILGKLERYSEAVQNFDLAIQYDPKNWEAYYNRGATYERLSEWGKALKNYEEAVKLQEKFAEGYFGMAEMYEKIGRQEEALSSYDKAIECNDRYAQAYFKRGKYYDRQQQYGKARKDLKRAMELNPELKPSVTPVLAKIDSVLIKDSTIYADKARALQEEGELMLAIEYYTISLERNADNTESYFQRGFCFHILGEYAKAIADYTEAISLERNPRFYFQRALSYQRLKEYGNALEDLDKTLELNSFFHAAHHRRALIFEEQGEYQKAVKSYQKAIEMAANKSYYYVDLARVYQKMNMEAEAAANWQRARAIVK